MMVARALLAIPAGLKRDPCKTTANVALILPVLKEIRNCEGRITISILSDPLSWYPVDCHLLELIDCNRLNLLVFDVRPNNVESGCKKG